MAHFLAALVRTPQGGFALRNRRTGALVARSVAGAFDSASRKQGLLGRDGLADGQALVIAPTQAIHTFFMRFPIDVAFVARDGRVVRVCNAVAPWRIAASVRAFAAVECAAGVLAESGTQPGDVLALEPVAAR